MECPALEKGRDYELIDSRILDPKERMIELLFRQREYQKIGKMIKNLWYSRKAILKYKKDDMDRVRTRDGTISITKSDPGPERKMYTPLERRSRGLSVSRG